MHADLVLLIIEITIDKPYWPDLVHLIIETTIHKSYWPLVHDGEIGYFASTFVLIFWRKNL